MRRERHRGRNFFAKKFLPRTPSSKNSHIPAVGIRYRGCQLPALCWEMCRPCRSQAGAWERWGHHLRFLMMLPTSVIPSRFAFFANLSSTRSVMSLRCSRL